jgi:hypothetical protein
MGEPVGEPQPEPVEPVERKPAGRAGMIGALLCLVAAVLTMIGMFQDLVVARNFGGPQGLTYRITLWDARVVADGAAESAVEGGAPPVPQNGVPLLFAVALLLAAALLGMLNRGRRAGRISRVSGLTAVVAATFLTAAVAMVIMQALWWMDILGPVSVDPREGVDVQNAVGVGPALWTLIVGVALAIAAAVLTWRQPRPEPERVEPETPRMGIPVVVRRLPDEMPDPEN